MQNNFAAVDVFYEVQMKILLINYDDCDEYYCRFGKCFTISPIMHDRTDCKSLDKIKEMV